jgi:pimeloyl-ACP methyl ester carboxylesterase
MREISLPSIEVVAPPFHIQSSSVEIRNAFPYFAYHESVSAMWAGKWRGLCAAGIYPFEQAQVEDFDPIFDELERTSPRDSGILHRPDDYATPFLPVGAQLFAAAEEAESTGDTGAARDLYLRAAAVYRIARFPLNRSTLGQEAWDRGKTAYEKAGVLLDPPSVAVEIPFFDCDPSAGDQDVPIQAYLRLPTGSPPSDGWPVLLFLCGLDAYKTDHTSRTQQHVQHGFATLSIEIPGTGDCPCAPADPTSPDRLMSTVLDWIQATGRSYGLDHTRTVARGVSTGGYYALRVAHVHADRLVAVVAQGSGCHHVFDPDWIRAQNQMDYPFALADALAYKFGYRDPEPAAAIERYASDARRFSLLESGVLSRRACRLLVINGMEDMIFPIEDSLLAATSGDNKDLMIIGNRRHMGNPEAEPIILGWIDAAIAELARPR